MCYNPLVEKAKEPTGTGEAIGAFRMLSAGIARTPYRCTSKLPPKTRHFALFAFCTDPPNRNDTMGLALLWVCVSNMHSIISVGWIGAKIDFGRSQGGVGVDIFSVLDLHVSTWVTYSPQDSVQRFLLASLLVVCFSNFFKKDYKKLISGPPILQQHGGHSWFGSRK
jgi:hypothetical protein